jgi:hypothetical protein
MLILFKHNAKKYAFDTVCGSLSVLSALEYRMLEAIQPPMEQSCPTALRYELAKYDSADVEEAYAELYDKAANGVIFAPEKGILVTPDTDADTAREALLAAAEALKAPVSVTGAHTALAQEILRAKGLLKDLI